VDRALSIAILCSFLFASAACRQSNAEHLATSDDAGVVEIALDAAPRERPIAVNDADPSPSGDAEADALEVSDADGDDALTAEEILRLDGSISTSIGGPSDGRVEGAIAFPKKAPGVILNPRRLNPESHYATVELVQAILRAAAVVEKAMPGGYPVIVNDIGFKTGGPIPHHASHQSGRDLDTLFYLFDREGNPRPAKGVPLNLRGQGWDFADLADPEDDQFVKIDAKRTWRFLQALAEDEHFNLQRIFVAEHLREILIREAHRAKAPREARRRIEDLTCQPGSPHDDHFHFRFFCTAEDIRAGCEDSPPIYPWRRAELKALGLRPVINRPRPRRRRAKTVSTAEARAKAGRMHWKVKAFLQERESWSEQPHPGRVFCR
jgi:penicillin-insensitive murein DD-endopeptidase